jgi:hypothetical protein
VPLDSLRSMVDQYQQNEQKGSEDWRRIMLGTPKESIRKDIEEIYHHFLRLQMHFSKLFKRRLISRARRQSRQDL